MLAVGVERDDELGVLHQRIADAGAKRGALAKVDRVGDDVSAGAPRLVGGVVR